MPRRSSTKSKNSKKPSGLLSKIVKGAVKKALPKIFK